MIYSCCVINVYIRLLTWWRLIVWKSLVAVAARDFAWEIDASADVLSSAQKAFTKSLSLSEAFSPSSFAFCLTYKIYWNTINIFFILYNK